MDKKDLIKQLANDIFLKKKVSFLIGSGMSLKSSKIKNDGLGDSNYFSHKFEEYLKILYGDDEYLDLIKEAQGKDNRYSFFAEKICENVSRKKGINEITNIFRDEILPIIHLESSAKGNNESIEISLNDKKICEKIKLNQGLECFGKIGRYFLKDTKIITSNFDPFLEIVLRKNNVDFLCISYSYNLEHRAFISETRNQIIIEHYHGYFLYETAHYDIDENVDNKEYFFKILSESDSLYIFGFGGWDDALTQAIEKILLELKSKCFVFWTFYQNRKMVKKEIKELERKKRNIDEEKRYNFLNNIKESKNSDVIYSINTNVFFREMLKAVREKVFGEELENYKNRMLSEYENFDINYIENGKYIVGKVSERCEDRSIYNIFKFVSDKVKDNTNVIICSKFGFGKTTVLKKFFFEYLQVSFIYPVIINLAYYELKDIVNNKLAITEMIYKKMDLSRYDYDRKYFLKEIEKFLQQKKIILILDGLDESIYKNNELQILIERIQDLMYPIITSVRLEFHDFIDYTIKLRNWNHIAIEICSWTKNSIEKYLSISKVGNDKKDLIMNLNKLNVRPLFLRLLCDIESNTLRKVKNNVSSLYYNIICNTVDEIVDLLDKKWNKVIRKIVKQEYFDTMSEIAVTIYLEFQKYKYEKNNLTKPMITFTHENIRHLASRNQYLDLEKFRTVLKNEKNTRIKLITTVSLNNMYCYTFFHRSLFEYLVANAAAIKIIREGKCSEAWNVYQTDEVSEYFVNEILSRRLEKNKTIKTNFYIAFKSEFKDVEKLMKQYNIPDKNAINNIEKEKYSVKKLIGKKIVKEIINYSERLEEVIYYIGKFNYFWSNKEANQFIEYFKFLFYNCEYHFIKDGNRCPIIDPIYYRTTAITLSRLLGNKFLYDYISFIILDYIRYKRKYFYTQVRKDITYYGKKELEKKCFLNYKEILELKNEEDLTPLNILKIFSYFVSMWFDESNNVIYSTTNMVEKKYTDSVDKMYRLKEVAEKNKFNNIIEMLEGVEYILKDIGFRFRIKKIDIAEKLNNAISKRAEIDSDVYRLVNCSGDELENLEIDFYDGHIIIDCKKDYYLNWKKEFLEILLKNLQRKIKSISIKYRDITNLNNEDVDFEVIYGKEDFNSRIDCEEDIKYIVKPKGFPKTGFFIDNRKIRKYILHNSKGKTILNLCSYTCSIGAAAIIGNAAKVVNVDKEEKYLNLGKEIYERNSLDYEEDDFVNESIKKFFEQNKNKYDIIILDLPELAKIPCNFKKIKELYKNYNKKAISILNPGGELITSCCSHGFSRERYMDVVSELVKNENVIVGNYDFDILCDHPINVNDRKSDYLKIISLIKI